MSSAVFPILRNMSHLLTALLYSVMPVMLFVMPRGAYRTTGNVFWVSIPWSKRAPETSAKSSAISATT